MEIETNYGKVTKKDGVWYFGEDLVEVSEEALEDTFGLYSRCQDCDKELNTADEVRCGWCRWCSYLDLL